MTINEIQDEIIDEFSMFDDWTDKYEYIIDIGKKLKPLPEVYKTEENKIKGCQSQVWLHPHIESDKVIFEGDSDAVIVKGLIGLLIRTLSGQRPEDIAGSNLYFIDKIGMSQHLAQTRSNGLASMVKQMKLYGLAYQAKQEVK
ncbi:SufE family protein [Rhodocytophaga rosea]|uniref:SufE family protein n=1 Tax=Rhodocytophaga rosea TaxID=2704465 RepID=A0A6C0GIV0_9BACT|nr:SufE family protein [Rhodocytophaga rosea]QHT67592.1 SufE family protein [Rhodocytophaga rosea]